MAPKLLDLRSYKIEQHKGCLNRSVEKEAKRDFANEGSANLDGMLAWGYAYIQVLITKKRLRKTSVLSRNF